jgi:hypothetical protein
MRPSFRCALLLLAMLLGGAPAGAQTHARTTAAAWLRAGPSAHARAVARVARGASVDVGRCRVAWCAVSAGGRSGWLPRHVIASASAEPRRARTPLPRVPERTGRGYVNSDGVWVRSPTFSHTAPSGASARCRDGSYSFSMHRRGTCSHHGGVAEWL